MEDGIKLNDIVRIGSSPKIKERLKTRCLKELPEMKFDRSQTQRSASIKNIMEELTATIKKRNETIQRQGSKSWGPKWCVAFISIYIITLPSYNIILYYF